MSEVSPANAGTTPGRELLARGKGGQACVSSRSAQCHAKAEAEEGYALEVIGYSERGAVNALIYELKYRAPHLLAQLLSKAFWPFTQSPDIRQEAEITVFVEQSLSDFGDADLVFLWQNPGGDSKGVIFCEVKRGAEWTLAKQWADFLMGVRGDDPRVCSNLFGQLYLKMCYVCAAKGGDLDEGITVDPPFHKRDGKATRKIGNNPVVRRASDEISSHLSSVHYLIVAPEECGPEVTSVIDAARQYGSALPYWGYSSVGYLSWHQIAAFAQKHGLRHFLSVLEYNQGQVF